MRDFVKDNMLRSKFNDSTILKILSEREIGACHVRRDYHAVLASNMAVSIIEDIEGADKVIAEGITMGVELAAPPFGGYEKEHFSEYIDTNDYLSIGVALTKQMLKDTEDERAAMIIDGVTAILEGRENLSEEAKAARIASRIYKGACNFTDERKYRDAISIAFERVLTETEKAGTVTEPDYIQLLLDYRECKDHQSANKLK